MIAGFTEEWFGAHSCAALAGVAGRVSHVDGLIVEVGSWEGRSTCVLANAVHPRTVEAVDTWQGSPGEVSAVLAVERDVFAQFRTNVDAYTRGNVNVWRTDWRNFVDALTEPVALLFIDAEHTYREVADTITAFLPLMAAGGVICGDDNHHPPIQQAVRDTLGDCSCDATLWIWWAT